MSRINVIYTRTRFEQPLVQLDGGPFNDAEYTPQQLRALAALLERAATAAEQRPCTGRHWLPSRVVRDTVADEVGA